MNQTEVMLKRISEQWFLREPAYFALYCMQHVLPDTTIKCPVRVSRDGLQYNPAMLDGMTFHDVEQLMRIELIRIFLKHPYERQPEGIRKAALALGSDITIAEGYNQPHIPDRLPLPMAKAFGLAGGEHFEWYSKRIDELIEEEDKSDPADVIDQAGKSELRPEQLDVAAAKAGLWQEDDLKIQEINDLIKSINQWGSIPGNIVQQIEASTQARIDYRQILQGFRGSILSSKHRLTRMRPNRRTSFQQMGSIRRFNTRLLVAVDVSGSITDTMLSHFYSIINKMFRYGIEEIDCVQFDYQMGEIRNIRKANRTIEVKGRGGTSFQPIFDYIKEHNTYDGVILLTDGNAPHPIIDQSISCDILWICDSEDSYNRCKSWMELCGRACWMIL